MSDVFENVITLDFETYYDKKFSLSKLTTEEYIRSPEFEVIGVGVQDADMDAPMWFTGTHKYIRKCLRQFNFEDKTLCAHNTMFDGAILSWVFDIHPKYFCDTMLMSRALFGVNEKHNLKFLARRMNMGEKGDEVEKTLGKHRLDFTQEELDRFGEYCVNDVALTHNIYREMKRNQFPVLESYLIDLTLRMYVEPTLVLDKELLNQHLEKTKQNKQKLLDDAQCAKEVLLSNNKFAQLLEDNGVEPPMKISARTGKETYALAKSDLGFKELLNHDNPKIQTYASARLGIKSTLEETRTQRLLDIAERGSLPVPLTYYGAHTGRWGGGGKINLQNLPSRGKEANMLKKAITAPDGYLIVDADLSQIEARVLAWVAGQTDLLDQFRNKEDTYKIMANKIYKVPVEKVDKLQRFIGKSVVLGCGFGMGHKKFRNMILQDGVDMTEDEAKKIIKIYRENNAKIVQFWQDTDDMLFEMIEKYPKFQTLGNGIILPDIGVKGWLLPNGLTIKYPNLMKRKEETEWGEETFNLYYDSKNGQTKLYGAKSVENIVQALARVIIGEQMVKVSSRYRVVMTVHDAIACIVPEGEAKEAQQFIEDCLREALEWADGLPLNCESGIEKSYGDC